MWTKLSFEKFLFLSNHAGLYVYTKVLPVFKKCYKKHEILIKYFTEDLPQLIKSLDVLSQADINLRFKKYC